MHMTTVRKPDKESHNLTLVHFKVFNNKLQYSNGHLNIFLLPNIYLQYLPSIFSLIFAFNISFNICLQYLPSIFSFNICLQYLPSIFAFNICLQYLLSIFAFNICLQYLPSIFAFNIFLNEK